MALAQQQKDSTRYYYELANNKKTNVDLIKSLNYLEIKEAENLSNGDTLNAIQNLRMIAIIQKDMRLLNKSENTSVKALQLLDQFQTKDSITKAARTGLNNNIGKIYRELGEYEKAIKHYDNIITNDPSLKEYVTALNNKGFALYEQQKYHLALENYTIAHSNSLILNDKKIIARAQDNLGITQSKLNNDFAFINMISALKIRDSLKFKNGIITSYLHLAEHFIDRNERGNASFYLEKAHLIANEADNINFKEAVLSLKMDLKNDPELLEYKKINEEISANEKRRRNSFAADQYDFNKALIKVKEIDIIAEKAKTKNIYYQFLGAFLLILFIFSYFILKSKYKKEKLQEIHNTEAHISKKIHDELGNDVFYLMSQIQSNPESLLNNKGVKVLNGLNNIYNKARDISKSLSKIETGNSYPDELTALLNSYGSDVTKIVTNQITPDFWKTVSKYKKEELYRILQELLTNMKKHSEATFAAVLFTKKQNKVIINYADNGIGVTKNDFKLNNGLSNVESRIDAINGNITFEMKPNDGFKVEIRFTA